MDLKETRDEIYDGLWEYYITKYEKELVDIGSPSFTEEKKYWIKEHYCDYIFNTLIDSFANRDYPTKIWTFELLGKAFLIIEKEIQSEIKIYLRNKEASKNAN